MPAAGYTGTLEDAKRLFATAWRAWLAKTGRDEETYGPLYGLGQGQESGRAGRDAHHRRVSEEPGQCGGPWGFHHPKFDSTARGDKMAAVSAESPPP